MSSARARDSFPGGKRRKRDAKYNNVTPAVYTRIVSYTPTLGTARIRTAVRRADEYEITERFSRTAGCPFRLGFFVHHFVVVPENEPAGRFRRRVSPGAQRETERHNPRTFPPFVHLRGNQLSRHRFLNGTRRRQRTRILLLSSSRNVHVHRTEWRHNSPGPRTTDRGNIYDNVERRA